MAEVIIVEDEPSTLKALHTVAFKLGHNVLSFCDPVAAIKAIEGQHVDILVTDWDLGARVSGVNVASRTQSLHPGSRVILITGDDLEQLKWQTRGLVNVSYIAKPFYLTTLRRALGDASCL